MLAGLKTRALRKRVWYRELSRMERGLLDLTMRWVGEVKSKTMTQVVTRILAKLVRALNRSMAGIFEKGETLAAKISELATEWENYLAHSWRIDLGFQRALGMRVTNLS
jgi:pyrimidine operon attenuation protein/uracil phosphoribosyltransferase